MERKIIEVAAAVIRQGDRILICSRPRKSDLADFWEFPGGKLEPGETQQQAIVREIREELAVDVIPGEVIHVMEHDYTDKYVRVTFLECTPAGPEFHPVPCDDQDMKWVEAVKIDQENMLPADLPLTRILAEKARKK